MGNERQRASGRALDATLQNEVLHPAVELEGDIPVRSSQRVAVAIQNPTADYRPDAIRETAASQWLLDLPSVSGGRSQTPALCAQGRKSKARLLGD